MTLEEVNKLQGNSLKLAIMELEIDKIYRKVSQAIYCDEYGVIIKNAMSIKRARHLDEYYTLNYPNIWKACKNMNNAKYKRTKRVLDKIDFMTSLPYCYFVTLTFRDSVLENTKPATRRKYVERALNSLTLFYVANIDFGDKEKNPDSNEREHYHAVVVFNSMIEYNALKESWIEQCGFTKIKRVKDDKESVERISKYTTKLKNHAFKESAKNMRILYSKKFNNLRKSVAPGYALFGEDLRIIDL